MQNRDIDFSNKLE
jgi:hypothetical protein